MNILIISIVLSAFCSDISAGIHTEPVEYKDGTVTLEGYLAYDEASKERRPAIIVAHDWMGVGPNVKEKAEMLAKLGYVAFAADIYGKGVRPANMKEASSLAGKYKDDRKLMRSRINAALDLIKMHMLVDAKKISAIGYCFGGTVVLELARSGANIAGVVSFHGGLGTPNPADAKNIRGKVLVLHGADDPFVPPAEVKAFEEEMRSAKVDWQMISYGNAVHSFTNPEAGSDNSRGAAYNEKADRRSWQAMKNFFAEIFK